ncbi:hypothetical protein OE88DRAFT_830878 [Heliocybe sulcata]|uniref:Uncharacterized protein n=1 Tax=Heliocybe sulcata TaxID=5364 RepID=A0A5C3MQK2_9AGAM|nr:hypothetical protein OE88DRAFT_830878 [Heliocybe sulcata]
MRAKEADIHMYRNIEHQTPCAMLVGTQDIPNQQNSFPTPVNSIDRQYRAARHDFTTELLQSLSTHYRMRSMKTCIADMQWAFPKDMRHLAGWRSVPTSHATSICKPNKGEGRGRYTCPHRVPGIDASLVEAYARREGVQKHDMREAGSVDCRTTVHCYIIIRVRLAS